MLWDMVSAQDKQMKCDSMSHHMCSQSGIESHLRALGVS